ncbi:ribosome recycling factor [Candidatus Parcubacteria bacterium]|nr:ribosome recycling factor [Candidatus Parcubacteria bacterium]
MTYNFNQFKSGAEQAVEWLKREYAGLRTGRASAAILDAIKVDAYGNAMAINQLAAINVEGPGSIRIVPWDSNVGKPIESAIQQSNLGLSVTMDDKGLRINFPQLTSERRAELAKVAKQKLEEARVRVRNEREKVHSDVDKQEKAGGMGKDDAYRVRQDLQKLVDEANKKLEELLLKKEKEITE